MIIIKNALVLTMDGEEIKVCQVEIDEDRIVYVGAERDSAGEVIDGEGKLLMPGLINAHAHSAMVKYRGVGEGLALSDWLEVVQEKEQSLTSDEIYEYTKIACQQYLRNGITTVLDCYFEPSAQVKAYEEMGVRHLVALGAKLNENDLSAQLEDEYLSTDKNVVAYAHSIYAVDETGFDTTLTFAKEKDLLFTSHLSETLYEVGECDKLYGCTPVAMYEKMGCFDRKSLMAHCVHLDKADLDILADNDVSVVTCPTSNSNLASGIAPIRALLNKGVNVCLGTDGASSSGMLDIFREMYLVNVLQKLFTGDANTISPFEIIKMATVNGAKALGIDRLGMIKEGYLADLILIDVQQAKFYPYDNLLSALVNTVVGQDVVLTMCGGKILYRRDI